MKVLFMSGYSDEIVAHRGVLREGAYLIEKPFTPEQLGAKIKAILPAAVPARILVADDDSGVRSLVRSVLELCGYVVIEAGDGREALDLLGVESVDLILTDLVMPECEGLEFIRQLRRNNPRARIIAMSGAFGGEYLGVAEMLGADIAMSKPLIVDELVASVKRLLSRVN